MENLTAFIFPTAQQAVEKIAQELQELSHKGTVSHISLSGGSTPKLLFKTLAQAPFNHSINWQNLHFWWGDERMVSEASEESNYGVAKSLLFDHIAIPAENLHPINGNADITQECERLEQEINRLVPEAKFDWIILGVGDDGHTASLFPKHTNYLEPHLCTPAQHPQTGQERISFTAKLLCQAQRITFLITGESKAQVIAEIAHNAHEASNYPAYHIAQMHHQQGGETQWYLDEPAGNKI